MLAQLWDQIQVQTRGRGFYEITRDVQARLRDSKFDCGLATVLIRHTSASLLIQENADPEVRRDFERFFSRLVQDGDPLFRHSAEGEDDMPAHVRTALTCVSLGIPFADGALALGTWQGLFVWEHRTSPHRREVVLHLLGDKLS